MTGFYSALTIYYISVIIGIFLHRYFSKFILSDFQYNNSLNIKRRWVIAYHYIVGIFFTAFIFNFIRNNVEFFRGKLSSIFIISSIVIIILWYCYIIYSIEVPKKYHKTKKWK